MREIGINSKTISDWTKAELIEDSFDKGKWRLFSLTEAIWIKFVEALRKFGVETSVIKELRDQFYPKKQTNAPEGLLSFFNVGNDEYASEIQKRLKEYAAKNNLTEEALKNVITQINIKIFESIIFNLLLTDSNLAFYGNGLEYYFIELSITNERYNKERLEKTLNSLNTTSFFMINLRQLVHEFFGNDKLIGNLQFFLTILNEKEKKIIEIIKSGIYNQILVKMKDDTVTHLRLRKNKSDELFKKIAASLKKGDYKEVSFTSKDGNIIKFDETEIIKMN